MEKKIKQKNKKNRASLTQIMEDDNIDYAFIVMQNSMN
jgi:hypothetical protein